MVPGLAGLLVHIAVVGELANRVVDRHIRLTVESLYRRYCVVDVRERAIVPEETFWVLSRWVGLMGADNNFIRWGQHTSKKSFCVHAYPSEGKTPAQAGGEIRRAVYYSPNRLSSLASNSDDAFTGAATGLGAGAAGVATAAGAAAAGAGVSS